MLFKGYSCYTPGIRSIYGVYSFNMFIPLVYRFVFSVTMFVGLGENFFFVKNFSRNTEPRILKFNTNVGYNLLYCVRENQPPPSYCGLYLSIFFLFNKNFCHRLLSF